MRLIKRTALQFTEDLWTWLAVNPEKEKEDYPEWEKNGGSIPDMVYDCPCCEYIVSVAGLTGPDELERWGYNRKDCARCPLSKLWPNGDCQSARSPFMAWWNANPKGRFGRLIRVSNATMIADAAREERLRLERKVKFRKNRRRMEGVRDSIKSIQKSRRRDGD